MSTNASIALLYRILSEANSSLFRAGALRIPTGDGWRYVLYSDLVPICSSQTVNSKVLNSRAALLSNYEVYNLLKELESDHLARSKTALRIKKEEEAAGNSNIKSQLLSEDVCEQLRTIEVEVRVRHILEIDE